ncbi:MAG: hypothetical protein BGO97_10565 [Micrococcales bacterium 70-64]|nr:zf-TFIIB domain-containing protein [Leifsonia sp.]ODU64427.1 MAG: hypothetical protein ABT06_10570 [Leifsonia sp. SCN 70-46]OJX86118.1 MAG: hypothetical protein BGO97_10565 [Micrococcales bacterium 70-64]
MKCPIDDSQLVMTERSGIEIDYCPQCRGVWLDRGELDKILERSAGSTVPQSQQQQGPLGGLLNRGGHHGGGHGTDQYGRRRKKESWLSELFD